MAVPSSILTRQGDVIPLANINKVSIAGSVITFAHSDGQSTDYNYQNAAAAASDFANISSLMDAAQVGSPEIYTVTPPSVTGLPQVIAISGISFDATAAIFLSIYGVNVALVTVFVNSTALTATVPGATPIGTYDVIYSDSNGAVSRAANGLIIY